MKKIFKILLFAGICFCFIGCTTTQDPFPEPGPGTNNVTNTNWPTGTDGNSSDWLPNSDGQTIIR